MPTQSTTVNTTAASIMDKAASLMNDTAKTVYTYDAQLPYLQMALDELLEHMELNNISYTNEVSGVIVIPAGTTVVYPESDQLTPSYPANLVSILSISERSADSSEPYVPVTYREFLPVEMIGIASGQLTYWTWQDQKIKFLSTNLDREILLQYIKTVFPQPLTEDSVIPIINCRSFLQYRTAGLCSRFVGENPTRADNLDTLAMLAIDRVTGIEVKSKQNQIIRRRPFLARYKSRY